MVNLPFNFLIASSRVIYAYKENKLKELQSSKGVYFGLTSCPFSFKDGTKKTIYIALARNNFDGTGGGTNTESVNTLEFFDVDLNCLGSSKLENIKDGHQIFSKDGDLYICNTGLNLISKATQDGEMSHFSPDGEHGRDINHYNSINFYNNRWYLTQHRKSDTNDAGVSVFDENWKYLEYIPVGKHAHDCIVRDGFLWSTDSFNGNLVRTELTTKKQVTYPISKYLTRGIIIAHDKILIGVSEFDQRETRHNPKVGRIMIFEYPSMQYNSLIEIPDAGQINGLLLV